MPEVRRVLPTEFDEVVQLWLGCGLTRADKDTVGELSRVNEEPDYLLLGLFDENRLLATAMASQDGPRGWVFKVGTLPERRRQGLAAALVAEAEEWLYGRGVRKVQLLVKNSNADALAFYERLGYQDPSIRLLAKPLSNATD